MKMRTFQLFLCVALLGACTRQTAVDARLDEKSVKTAVTVTSWPTRITSDTDFPVGVRLLNAGETVLPSLGKDGSLLQVGVSYHWLGTDNRMVTWDGFVTPLKHDLEKGKTLDLQMKVRSPAVAGKYILEIEMLQNSAFWFAATGSQTARIVMDVVN